MQLSNDKTVLLEVNNNDIKPDGSYDIPKGVTFIGEQAFMSCNNLQTLIIHEGVQSIGYGAFMCCSSLQTLIIHEGLKSIGIGAFMYCSSLQTLIIPKGVISIGVNAFSGCSNLKNLTILSTLAFIGEMAFKGCCNLENIIIASKEGEEIKRITALLPKNMQNKVTTVTLVEEAHAFMKCQLAKLVQIPETNLMYRFFNLNSRFSPQVQIKDEHGQSVQVGCKKLPNEIFQHINRFNNPFAVKTEKHMQSVPLPKNENEMIAYKNKVEKIANQMIETVKSLHAPLVQKPVEKNVDAQSTKTSVKPYEQVKKTNCSVM